MGSESDYEMTNKILTFFQIIKGRQPIYFGEKVVNKTGTGIEIITTPFRNQDILWRKLKNLVRILKRDPIDIGFIPQITQSFDRNPDFPWPEMGQGHINNVKPDRTILEHKQVMRRSEDSFLNQFDGFIPGDKSFYPFDQVEIPIPDSKISKCLLKQLSDIYRILSH